MMPLGCLSQLYCECLDIVTQNPLFDVFDREGSDVLYPRQATTPALICGRWGSRD
jgi:hypothetical protein